VVEVGGDATMQGIWRLTPMTAGRFQIFFRRRITLRNEQLSSNSSSSSKPPPPPPSRVAKNDEASALSTTTETASKINQWIGSLSSAASETASRAAEKAARAATETTEAVAARAKTAAAKAAADVRRSMTNAKISAKKKGEQYAWEAHRSAARMGENAKRSAGRSARKSGERIRGSMSEATRSARERVAGEISRRMPKMPEMPRLPFANESASAASESAPGKALSDALPGREALLKSASAIASETITKTTANVTSQVQETVGKTTRWLWWWGLAAVGVYGVSTTLTKEGVQLLKDMVSSPRESFAKDSSNADAASATDDVPAGVSLKEKHIGAGDADSVDGDRGNGGWLSSWFPSRTNGAGKEGQDIDDTNYRD